VDGMVNALYDLHIVEHGTNKAMLRELSETMLEIQEQGKISARKVQEMSNAMMSAFYEFPFTLPSELVYIARATSLIEGIGFIHDPYFDAVAVGRPIIKEMAQDLLAEEFKGDFLDTLKQWAMQSYQTIAAFQDTIIKLDREQFRLHLHPIDLQTFNAMLSSSTRRVIGTGVTLFLGMMVAVVYLRTGNLSLLLVGNGVCGVLFLLLLLLPAKMPRTKYARFLSKQLKVISSSEGEVYKSFVIGQMTPEERERLAARRSPPPS